MTVYTDLIQLSLSFIPSADPPASKDDFAQEDSNSTRSPTTLAFSFLPDYRLDLSVRSLVGSRSRLQDVPKIAQIVEARIHQWFDERCVEPRVQQIVLPNLWPRKRNTRGGEEDEDEEGSAVGEDMVDELVERADGNRKKKDLKETSNDDSLEARMAAEGRKLKEAETKQDTEQRIKEQQANPTLRRRPGHNSLAGVEGFKMPGHFE
jgi:maintenance of morphology protein 1